MAAIRALESAYDSACDAGDAASTSRLFARDAVAVNPPGGVSLGRNEVVRSPGALFAGRGRGSTHASNALSVRLVSDDSAVVGGEAIICGFGSGPSPLQHRPADVLVPCGGERGI
ncbi:MAG: SgcJ/EcaC family oxidoreductase [Chloroflexi bacterium]|nr:SgcJ/EcaC family oxidoreductase [Chloroflexota bacterium]